MLRHHSAIYWRRLQTMKFEPKKWRNIKMVAHDQREEMSLTKSAHTDLSSSTSVDFSMSLLHCQIVYEDQVKLEEDNFSCSTSKFYFIPTLYDTRNIIFLTWTFPRNVLSNNFLCTLWQSSFFASPVSMIPWRKIAQNFDAPLNLTCVSLSDSKWKIA